MEGVVNNPKPHSLVDGRRNFNGEEVLCENPHVDPQNQDAPSSEEHLQQGNHGAILSSE
jgi:hypothetical protein